MSPTDSSGDIVPLGQNTALRAVLNACADPTQPPGAVAASAIVAAIAAAVADAGDLTRRHGRAWASHIEAALTNGDADIDAYWNSSDAATTDTPLAVAAAALDTAQLASTTLAGNTADLDAAYILAVAASAAASSIALHNNPRTPPTANSALLHPAAPLDAQPLLTVDRAHGAYLHDEHGDRWFDASSGMWNVPLGHGHPGPVAALLRQTAALSAVDPFQTGSPVVEAVANQLRTLCGFPDAKVVFGTSGSEVIEIAMRLGLAALPSGAPVWAMPSAFHGSTAGAAALTGFEAVWGPLPRSAKWPRTAPPSEWVAPGLAFTEPLVGARGYQPHTADDLAAIARFRERGGILVVDEIATGLGRAGWPLAAREVGLTADMTVVGKGLGNGVSAVSALILDADIAARALGDGAVDFGHTHSNHVLGAAVTSAVLDALAALNYSEAVASFRAALQVNGIQAGGRGFLAVVRGEPRDRAQVLAALTRAKLVCHLPSMADTITQLVIAPPITTSGAEAQVLADRVGDLLRHLSWPATVQPE